MCNVLLLSSSIPIIFDENVIYSLIFFLSPSIVELISMIDRIQGDTLHEQKTSPSPRTTPEPNSGISPSSSHSDSLEKRSPGETRHRSHHHHSRKRGGSAHNSHRALSGSRSIDPEAHRGHHHRSGGHRDRLRSSGKDHADSDERKRRHDNYLKPSSPNFGRTQSGSSISSSHKSPAVTPPMRAMSPPASMNRPITDYEMRLRNNNISPPPPTSKPPPLPSNAMRMSGPRKVASDARWSNASFRSTDSASSEDSDLPRQARVHHGSFPDHTYVNKAWQMQHHGNSQPDLPRYFPRAHSNLEQAGSLSQPSSQEPGPMYVNTRSYQRSRPSSSKAGSNSPPMPPPPTENNHPLDNLVNEAYLQAPSGVNGQRKTSHPLQNSLSHGPMTSSGTQLSSYPWHNAQRR